MSSASLTGADNDSVHAGDRSPVVVAPVTVDAGPGQDKVIGSVAADRLDGGSGVDRVYGGLGADWLVGGKGDDLLSDPDQTASTCASLPLRETPRFRTPFEGSWLPRGRRLKAREVARSERPGFGATTAQSDRPRLSAGHLQAT